MSKRIGFFTLALHTLMILALVVQPPAVRAQTWQSSQPKLVLMIVLDQFNYDYLNRFQDKLGTGGFRLLMEGGAHFTNCKYTQATTQTAVGHSIIATGALPWATGVIANDWYSRGKDKEVLAVSDDSAQMVGANGPGASARAMQGSTIGDQMKLATNGRSKVITISLKDRGAVFLAGKLANEAYWWDMRTGTFVTSSQYGSTLSGWAKTFNDSHYADKFYGKPWQRLLPETAYGASTKDDYVYERPIPGDGRQFPHVITGGGAGPGPEFYGAFAMSPFANQMLADLAREAIDRESLGQHTDPDMLGISFSATDYVGHSFGPYSQEAEDMFLRLDQSLASLFVYIDQKIGLDRCLIVVTGDHGSMPIPEFLKERGLDAGRIDPKAFKTLLDSALDARLGADDWITSFQPPNLYLNLATIDKQKYRQPEVESLAAKLSHGIPGISEAYTAGQLFANNMPNGPLTESVRQGYYWGRSGELVILPKPGYIFSSEPTGTSHGSPYAYDAQVPLLLYGTGIRAGKYGNSCAPQDIAPTLATVVGTAAPSLCEGRVLTECLSPVQGPPRPANMPLAAPADAQVK